VAFGKEQAFPQVPQFMGSVERFTQVVPQTVSPLGQVQVPDWQMAFVAYEPHEFPQVPQLFGSVFTLVHRSEQTV
jgi:hypothetical protein